MALTSIFNFNISNIFDDVTKKSAKKEAKGKKERMPLNLTKEAIFTVKLLDPNCPYIKYELDRTLLVLEDGLHVIDPYSKRELFFFSFPSIKTFRLNPAVADEWQIYFKSDGKRFEWYSFISDEAALIHETVLDIVDNIVLDRDMFESGDAMQ